MTKKLSFAQTRALAILMGTAGIRRERDGTYMPYADEERSFDALVRRGLARTTSAGSDGYIFSGYVVTDTGQEYFRKM